ncbi:MAG TPA: LysR substrate-binding domain-containing protein [Acidimicrobiales bacterium]|nr:LysR substrate-binding domain-containing protein [Acidimicrobiales bacterium]
MRAAAERLFVSQPAVSAAVAAIHKELEVALVTRQARGLQLTPSEDVFAGYARQLLGLLDEAKEATVGQGHPERGRVRRAAVTSAGEHALPRLLASFRSRFAETEVSSRLATGRASGTSSSDGEVDLAVGGRPPGSGRFTTLATRPNVLVLVAADPADPAPDGCRDVSLERLRRQVLLLHEAGSGTRSTAEELLDELGISPRALTLGSNGVIRESVLVGLDITLISRDAGSRELDERALEEWRCPAAGTAPDGGRESIVPRQRAWHLVARAGDELPPTARLFLTHIADPDAALGGRFQLVDGS